MVESEFSAPIALYDATLLPKRNLRVFAQLSLFTTIGRMENKVLTFVALCNCSQNLLFTMMTKIRERLSHEPVADANQRGLEILEIA